MNRPLRLAECSQPISWVFCVYFVGGRCIIATRQQCCCNPFRMHSRNIRNVFVICVLHIRRVKVWFLACKKGVFGMQEVGFCIAKVWFLFFECCVVAICLECYHNPFAAKWQSVSNILAIRSPCFGNSFAALSQSVSSRRGPIYRAHIYENIHKMTNGNVRALK